MKAIILAAGRGTRMGALTDTYPKPMLQVLNKNLLEWKLDRLPKEINEVIFIVGYLQEVIRNHFGSTFGRFKISYLEQTVLDGSGGALWLAKDLINESSDEKFLVLMGDDIYSREDLENLIKEDQAVLGMDVDNKYGGGKLVTDENLNIIGIDEGLSTVEKDPEKNYFYFANTGAYVVSKNIFTKDLVKVKESEYGLPHTLLSKPKENPHTDVKLVRGTFWLQITSPESIGEAEEILKHAV